MTFADPLPATLKSGDHFPAAPAADNPGLDAFVALCGEAACKQNGCGDSPRVVYAVNPAP